MRMSRHRARSRERHAKRRARRVSRPPSSRRHRGSGRASAGTSSCCERSERPGPRPLQARYRTRARTSSAVPAPVRPQPARPTARTIDRELGDEPPRPCELVRRHRREVARAQELVCAPPARLRRPPVHLRTRAWDAALAALGVLVRRRIDRSKRAGAGDAQEPRVEGTVERLEVLVARDERLPQRPVDVLAARQVDGVQGPQRVRDAPRADLEAALPQHTSEDDDMPDYGVWGLSHDCSQRALRARRRESRARLRGT